MALAHGTPELLTAYADGSLSEGLSLLVASHLTFCPACRRRVGRLEALGGALLRDGASVAPSPSCLAGALARTAGAEAPPLAAEEPPVPAPLAASPLPAPLRARLGLAAEDICWRCLLPGLTEHCLTGFEGEEVRLIRAVPGTRILQHTHVGFEATLILSGRMRDGDRVFVRGDLALADATDDHRPQIEGPEPCLCLMALTGTDPVHRSGRARAEPLHRRTAPSVRTRWQPGAA